MEQAAQFQRQQVTGVRLVELGFLAGLRFAQGQPTANAHVVEHLQQPFHFRPVEGQLKPLLRRPEPARVFNKTGEVLLVFLLLAQE